MEGHTHSGSYPQDAEELLPFGRRETGVAVRDDVCRYAMEPSNFVGEYLY
jgi:hypothetical protein